MKLEHFELRARSLLIIGIMMFLAGILFTIIEPLKKASSELIGFGTIGIILGIILTTISILMRRSIKKKNSKNISNN